MRVLRRIAGSSHELACEAHDEWVNRLWSVQLVSDSNSHDGSQHSTKWMIAQIVCLWGELVTVHEDVEDHFRLRPESADTWRTYLESRLLRDPDARICVALHDTTVIGFLVARLEHPAPMFSGDYYGFVSDCFIRPEYRKQGVATALFDAAARWLTGKGVHELQLDVYNRNATALEYWANMGFRPLKTRMVLDLQDGTAGGSNK